MGKRLSILGLITALLLLAVPPPAPAQYVGAFYLSVLGDNNDPITQGRCRVLTAGTNTDAPSIFSDYTLKTAIVTPSVVALDTTKGFCQWYAKAATTSFDAIVYVDAGPYQGVKQSVIGLTRTASTLGGRLVRVNRSGQVKSLSIFFTQNTSNQTSTTTLPAGAVVIGAEIETQTAVASSTVSFGFAGGQVTSFCNAVSAATTGIQSCGIGAGIQVGGTASALMYVTSASAINGYAHVHYLLVGE